MEKEKCSKRSRHRTSCHQLFLHQYVYKYACGRTTKVVYYQTWSLCKLISEDFPPSENGDEPFFSLRLSNQPAAQLLLGSIKMACPNESLFPCGMFAVLSKTNFAVNFWTKSCKMLMCSRQYNWKDPLRQYFIFFNKKTLPLAFLLGFKERRNS